MTTPQPDRAAALGAAERLNRTLAGVEARLGQAVAQGDADSRARDEALARANKRNGVLVIIAMVGLVLDVTATGVAFIALSAEHRNSATVAEVHQSNLDGCNYNNVRLANQAKALDKILESAQAPANATPAQMKASAEFENRAHAAVALGWASRDCAQAYSLTPPKGK